MSASGELLVARLRQIALDWQCTCVGSSHSEEVEHVLVSSNSHDCRPAAGPFALQISEEAYDGWHNNNVNGGSSGSGGTPKRLPTESTQTQSHSQMLRPSSPSSMPSGSASADIRSPETPGRSMGQLCRNSSTPSSQLTPRQVELMGALMLPRLTTYPIAPGGNQMEPEGSRQAKLLQAYRHFVLEMHGGLYLTQLTSLNDYTDIHCQITGDLQILKLDQCNGQLVEFPIALVTNMYCVAKVGDKCFPVGGRGGFSQVPVVPDTEFQVVVEFARRALVFVFRGDGCQEVAERFVVCMRLVVVSAQQSPLTKKRDSSAFAWIFSGGSDCSMLLPSSQYADMHPAGSNDTIKASPKASSTPDSADGHATGQLPRPHGVRRANSEKSPRVAKPPSSTIGGFEADNNYDHGAACLVGTLATSPNGPSSPNGGTSGIAAISPATRAAVVKSAAGSPAPLPASSADVGGTPTPPSPPLAAAVLGAPKHGSNVASSIGTSGI